MSLCETCAGALTCSNFKHTYEAALCLEKLVNNNSQEFKVQFEERVIECKKYKNIRRNENA